MPYRNLKVPNKHHLVGGGPGVDKVLENTTKLTMLIIKTFAKDKLAIER